jgi:PqqD family protein of HPr-rel-A system
VLRLVADATRLSVYRAAAPSLLRIVPLDDLTAIYHRSSGITHLVASPVPELIETLREPLSLVRLAKRLGEQFYLSDGDALAARLDELVATGLVERL